LKPCGKAEYDQSTFRDLCAERLVGPRNPSPQIRAQLKTEGRAKIGLSEFFEYFLQCTAGFGKTYSDNFTDVFELAEMISKMCK
jgi:hypothetical protein